MPKAPWTVAQFVERLQARQSPSHAQLHPMLPVPAYTGDSSKGVCLAVESMRRHLSDEGWQIQAGLMTAGYTLYGNNLPNNHTSVPHIVQESNPGIIVMQDKREWDAAKEACWDKKAAFSLVGCLAQRSDIFKLTMLKDAHQNPAYHSESAAEMGAHAWIIYYAPAIVKLLAPYIREQHLIRTCHSVDVDCVPTYTVNREGCLLSGAVSGAYPLRQRLVQDLKRLPRTERLPHPGYHANGCQSPAFLQQLSKFKVAICTASIFGYSLRKLVEATAAGCVVVTDLPVDDVMPEIDGNLIRVSPEATAAEVAGVLQQLYRSYDPEKQQDFVERVKRYYDYREVGRRLANDIDQLRQRYNQPAQ